MRKKGEKDIMKKVLIIDDTKNIRILLQKTLELEGYIVSTASTGKAGLDLLQTESFNLVFLDVKLPEMSGTEVLRQMRAQNINTPVIIITAYPTVKNAVDCIQLGALTYLQKPFTAERLKNILTQFNLTNTDPQEDPALQMSLDIINNAIEQGNYLKAIRLLKSCFAENPSDFRLYRLMASAYRGMGDNAEADRYEKAADIFKK